MDKEEYVMFMVWEEIYKLMSKEFTFKIGPCCIFAVDNASEPNLKVTSLLPTDISIPMSIQNDFGLLFISPNDMY